MKRTEIIGVVFLIFFLAGCVTYQTKNSNSSQNQTLLASEKCANSNGTEKLLYGPSGQYGLCLFPDGSVCDEISFLSGECSKGECMRSCNYTGTRSEGWYDCHGTLLFWDKCSNESAATAGSC